LLHSFIYHNETVTPKYQHLIYMHYFGMFYCELHFTSCHSVKYPIYQFFVPPFWHHVVLFTKMFPDYWPHYSWVKIQPSLSPQSEAV